MVSQSPSLSPTLSPEWFNNQPYASVSSWDVSDDESSPFRYYPLILFVVVILFVVAESFKAKPNPYDDHRHLIRHHLRWQRRRQPNPEAPPPDKSNNNQIINKNNNYNNDDDDNNNNNNNDSECAICLEDMKLEEERQVFLECNHGFHKVCIHHWLVQDSHCPLCRRTITNIENV